MSEEKQYSLDKEDDDYNECLLDPNNDRRIIICDSHNKADGIIHCIGSIESQYIPDGKVQQTEKTHGTGTVIHIDNQNNIYVLTAAHNILIMEKECKECKTKTLKTYCPNKKCHSPYKTKKTSNLIKPTHIYFSRRGHDINTLGQTISRYQVEEYKLPNEYYKFPTPRGGYDIAILIIKCHDKNDVALYKQKCSNICLINDETFGGKQNILNIYGFPGEKRKEENYRIYYYLFGMSSSKLDKTNKFEIAKHEQTNKSYVVNKGIDTTSGQSGSCIYSYGGNNTNTYLIYGIHSGGSQKKRANWGTFFDINNIEWIANVLAENDMYLENMISNKFMICHYTLVLSRELHKKNISIPSGKKEDFEITNDTTQQLEEKQSKYEQLKTQNNALKYNITEITNTYENKINDLRHEIENKQKQRTQQLEIENEKLKNLIEEIVNENQQENIPEIKENEHDNEQNEEIDYFDTNLLAKGMNISNNNKIITNKNVGWMSGCNTSYGTKIIPSITKNKTYIWKLENIHTKTVGSYIGIDNAEGKWVNTSFAVQKDQACYAYGACYGDILGWNQNEKTAPHTFNNEGDILTMKLSFNENCGVLSFKVNNGQEFIATDKVAQDNELKYRMAVSSSCTSTMGIELLGFKQI